MYTGRSIESLLTLLSREFGGMFEPVPVVEEKETVRVSIPDEKVEFCLKKGIFMKPFLKSLARLARVADEQLSGLESFELVREEDNLLSLRFKGTMGSMSVTALSETTLPVKLISLLASRKGIKKFKVTHKAFMTRKISNGVATVSFVDDKHYEMYEEYVSKLDELGLSCAVGWLNKLGLEAFFPKSIDALLRGWHSVKAASALMEAGLTDVLLLEHNYSKYVFREFHNEFRKRWERDKIAYKSPLGELSDEHVDDILMAHEFLKSIGMDVRGLLTVILRSDRMVVKTTRKESTVWYEDIREDMFSAMEKVEKELVDRRRR